VFTGINRDICEMAWQMVLPAIEASDDARVTNKFDGCIVVIDPRPHRQGTIIFREVIRTTTPQKYRDLAIDKAQLTQEHKLPSSVIQQQFPYLFNEGDSKWGGSTIDDGGLIVAFSGVQAVFDEMIAEWMASAIRALCRHEMTREGGVMSEDYSYIGGQ
jgi:hypothetical protein